MRRGRIITVAFAVAGMILPAAASASTVKQERWIQRPAFLLPPVKLGDEAARPAWCARVSNCVPFDQPDTIYVHERDGYLMAHELGHTLDFRLAALAPATAARFRARWQAINANPLAWQADDQAAPMEQFATSFGLCARRSTWPQFHADMAAWNWQYFYHYNPTRSQFRATCSLIHTEVNRLWRVSA